MACVTRAVISANGGSFTCHRRWSIRQAESHNRKFLTVSATAASTDDSDCNTDECAPDKEVGKVSMEWLAGEKTKVVGTYPPQKKSWTGYVEKDTAGQTNIYAVEPAVYVAENAISSGTSGSSSDGSENTAALSAGLALVSIAAAASILLQVGKNAPPATTTKYSGPPLSYYVSKFQPPPAPATIEEPLQSLKAEEAPTLVEEAPQVSKIEAVEEAPQAPEIAVAEETPQAPEIKAVEEAPQVPETESSG